MTASSYSVNILLDATKAKSELASLEKRVNTFRQKMMKAISFEDKGARKREKAIRDTDKRRTADIRDAYFKKRVRDLELKGVKGLEEANKQLDKTQEDINKKAYGALRTRLKIVKDEINAAVRLNNEKAKGVAIDKKAGTVKNPNKIANWYGPQQAPTYGAGQAPVSIDARYNQQVRRAGFENRINMLSAQGIDQDPFRQQMGRITQAQAGKKGTNLGLLKQENREMDKLLKKAESKLRLSRKELQVNKAIVRDKAQMVKAEGDFSMLSDRRSYDVKGRRTFANNRFGRALGGRGFDRAAGMQGALISGAFPLLFGQGPAVAAAGAVGGGLGGGLFGQGGSFAGGIAATAAVTAISQLVNSVKELGTALRKPSENIDILVQRAGISGTALERQVSKLKELGLEATAADIALAEIDEFADVEQLKKLSKSFEQLGNTFAKLNTQVLSFVSQGLGDFAFFLNEVMQGASAGFTLRDVKEAVPKGREDEFNKMLGKLVPGSLPSNRFTAALGTNFDRAKGFGADVLTPDVLNQLRAEFVPSSAPAKVKISQDLLGSARSVKIDNLKSEIELEAQRLTQRSEEQDVIRKTNEIKKIESQIALKKFEFDKTEEGSRKDKLGDKLEELRLQRDLNKAQLENARILADPVQAAVIGLQKELNKLNDIRYQLVEAATAIGNAFSESFKGIVSGSMTAQQALANLFQRTADHFLDMAAQMIAKQIQMKILGIGFNLFAGADVRGAATDAGRSVLDMNQIMNGGLETVIGGNRNRATGGPVSGGSPYIVGEKGPELFVPGASGNIVPNHAMGGANVVVNVDASGSSVQGDSQSASELGEQLAAVVQAVIINEKRVGGLLN